MRNRMRSSGLNLGMRVRLILATLLPAVLAISASAQSERGGSSVEIDLQEQMAWLIQDGRAILSTSISTGRAGHFTETGSFQIIEKERNHFSNMYGKILDARGDTVVSDADADMAVPRGGKFVTAPMRYFMRFNGAIGMHAGYLPGYAASHGCVRLPEANAIALFNAVDIGTPVTVFGLTPRGRGRNDDLSIQRRTRSVRDPRLGARGFDPFAQPIWWR